MIVRFRQEERHKWRWRLDDWGLAINAGATRTFYFKFNCRRDFKKRYLALTKKRKNWPAYLEVEEL